MNIELAHQVELMGLDSLHAQVESGGDLLHGSSFGEHLQDLALAFGQGPEARLALAAAVQPEPVHQSREETRCQVTPAAMDLADAGQQLFGGTVLEHVPAASDLDALGEVVLVIVHREKDDARLRPVAADLAGGFEA